MSVRRDDRAHRLPLIEVQDSPPARVRSNAVVMSTAKGVPDASHFRRIGGLQIVNWLTA